MKTKRKEEEVIKEMELLKNLDHPNILKIYDILHDEDNYYIVTEYTLDV